MGFALKDSLKLRIKNLHPEKRPFFCNCKGRKSTFKSRRGLARHVNNAHPGDKLLKPYPCLQPDCAVRFRDNRSLHDHLRKAHGAEKLTCDYGNCKKAFNSSRRLNDHKKETLPQPINWSSRTLSTKGLVCCNSQSLFSSSVQR